VRDRRNWKPTDQNGEDKRNSLAGKLLPTMAELRYRRASTLILCEAQNKTRHDADGATSSPCGFVTQPKTAVTQEYLVWLAMTRTGLDPGRGPKSHVRSVPDELDRAEKKIKERQQKRRSHNSTIA
jgi:hypothetical protein